MTEAFSCRVGRFLYRRNYFPADFNGRVIPTSEIGKPDDFLCIVKNRKSTKEARSVIAMIHFQGPAWSVTLYGEENRQEVMTLMNRLAELFKIIFSINMVEAERKELI